MHSYKLTRRGKTVLTMFVMMLSLVIGSLFIKDIAIASDGSEIILQKPVYLSNTNSNNQSISFSNELKRLRDNGAANEILIADDLKVEDIDEKEILSINVEDISSLEGKIAFLTFDDGPSHNVTPLVLETLKRYNIYATFFVLGNMCEKNGYMLKEVRDRGHSIGVHSYTHELNTLLKSRDSFINEIKMTEDAIKKNLGEDFSTRLFRFPGGSFEPYKRQYMDDLQDLGYVSVDWNALTGDSEYVNPKAEILMERLKSTIINKDRIIVLMHDSDTKQVSAEILPDIIEHLKTEGYEFAVLK
ncbi:polysaccharide deacetylase [Sedimentibacter hydroxybenzoicus DSM 7310]|uniref:Polysaccharide deacetylase n=1 Tax=Sedimentibacter hydroxybenzoicus DSM 7310 TaxID=1123245 RepID=A0A974BKX7_SEDHY|nr:polysaccharide deacetylase family protein [Sedimentibacter hydroxybenzoicus]NYB74642.1 polysaccharide deacetylase [Sedimentibacter hydroxybenzoicus DSM 7310]